MPGAGGWREKERGGGVHVFYVLYAVQLQTPIIFIFLIYA